MNEQRIDSESWQKTKYGDVVQKVQATTSVKCQRKAVLGDDIYGSILNDRKEVQGERIPGE